MLRPVDQSLLCCDFDSDSDSEALSCAPTRRRSFSTPGRRRSQAQVADSRVRAGKASLPSASAINCTVCMKRNVPWCLKHCIDNIPRAGIGSYLCYLYTDLRQICPRCSIDLPCDHPKIATNPHPVLAEAIVYCTLLP